MVQYKEKELGIVKKFRSIFNSEVTPDMICLEGLHEIRTQEKITI